MEMNNPAGRLLAILTEGKKISKNTPCREAWSQLLELKGKSAHLLIGRVGKVYSLADDIAAELSRLDNVEVSRFMGWTRFFENSFTNCNLDQPWSSFINHISEPAIDYLHMTSSLLSTNRPQPVLKRDELESISESAQELIQQVISSDLPLHLKKYFLEQLRKIKFAVEEYQITGSAQVAEIVEATFGKAILNQELVKAKDTHESAKSFWSFMAKTALVVSTTVGGLQLTDTVIKAFPELAKPFKQELSAGSDNAAKETEANVDNEV
ncbi:hypothetical protein [Vibrio parahaemolyticus]|uniref:hypothetical protein n=1 Tax=Vibrio parahaemolyticus TaxID=670 RepID=UPI0004191CAD|nr:hypothetical protein [Vibrio parahaemolyticus]HAS7010773.1 hypothetical protein [Vibrio parahaemolyticus]HCE2651562.1 hypothetical protein [Vibrio parahaemolyticus]HCE5036193.1 hypothetical protein [Vibrio parahaemolyticus]HCG8974451.1 hypothetical protein [Vibrio parahaemolyticus]HCG9764982.1 hypothetical protein [Vibrio parahaemolyticus]